MSEVALRGIETHGKRERRALHACRVAGRILAHSASTMLRATGWLLRLASPSMQRWTSAEGSTGLPGNPWPGAWAGPRANDGRSSHVR